MPLMIGIDTGGSFTDAVAYDDDRGVVAKAKALTTRRDLSLGIAAAVDAVLAGAAVDPSDVTLVSMSTTLATNAIVEGQGGRVCLVLIGMADRDLDQADLRQSLRDDEVIFLAGGHDAHGAEVRPLDTGPLRERLAAGEMAVTGFAVAGLFAARNPAHEQAVAREIREATDLAVTCSTELSARLNAPKRALTSVLNARLIGLIRHLIVATEDLLAARAIKAPLMVVRGAVISSPAEGSYRVHLESAPGDFTDLDEAVTFAEKELGDQAAGEARRNSAGDIEQRVSRTDRTATSDGREIFIESVLTATASGRPQFAH